MPGKITFCRIASEQFLTVQPVERLPWFFPARHIYVPFNFSCCFSLTVHNVNSNIFLLLRATARTCGPFPLKLRSLFRMQGWSGGYFSPPVFLGSWSDGRIPCISAENLPQCAALPIQNFRKDAFFSILKHHQPEYPYDRSFHQNPVTAHRKNSNLSIIHTFRVQVLMTFSITLKDSRVKRSFNINSAAKVSRENTADLQRREKTADGTRPKSPGTCRSAGTAIENWYMYYIRSFCVFKAFPAHNPSTQAYHRSTNFSVF